MTLVERHLGHETDPVCLRRRPASPHPPGAAPVDLTGRPPRSRARDRHGLCRGAGGRRRGPRPGEHAPLGHADGDVATLRGRLALGAARPGLDVDRDTRWLVVRRLIESAPRARPRSSARKGDRSAVQRTTSRPSPLGPPPDPDAKAAGAGAADRPAGVQPRLRCDRGGVLDRRAGGAGRAVPRALPRRRAPDRRARPGLRRRRRRRRPAVPTALPRLERLPERPRVGRRPGLNTVLARGWRDTVDDYDVALAVRRAG